MTKQLTKLELAKVTLKQAQTIFIRLKIGYNKALEQLAEAQHEYLVELEEHYESKQPKP